MSSVTYVTPKFRTLEENVASARALSDFSPPPDPGERLPKAARDKLATLRARADATKAQTAAIYAAMKSARIDLRDVETSIDRRLRFGVQDDDAGLIVDREARERISKEIEEQKTQHDEARKAASAAATLVARCEDFARRVRMPVGRVPGPSPVRKGEQREAAVARIRAQMQIAMARLDAVRNASVALPEAIDVMRHAIEQRASRGRPNIEPCFRGREPEFSTTASQYKIGFGGENGHSNLKVDAGDLLVWICKDDLIAALEREIREADDGTGIPAEERKVAIAALEAELLEAEIAEEAVIADAEQAGQFIDRRPDVRPETILGVIDTAAPGAKL